MLQLCDASYAYAPPIGMRVEGSERQACGLRDASLKIEPGERVGIVGANGSGKSTLLACLCGRIVPMHGYVELDGKPVDETLRGALRKSVGIVGQDPDDQMVATTLFEEVGFGPCNLGLPREEVVRRIEEALARCGLTGLEDRDVATLSGGQRQRAALAGILAMRPACVLADEPCSMLDPAGRNDVASVFGKVAQSGGALIQVTHHIEELAGYDRVTVMGDGAVVWEGAPEALLLDEEAFARSACVASVWVEAARALVSAGELAGSDPLLDPVACAILLRSRGEHSAKLGRDVVLDIVAHAVRKGAGGVREGSGAPCASGLHLHGARASYRSGRGSSREVLRGVDLEVRPGEIVLVVGRTGSGKSTLARAACGLIELDVGFATVGETPVRPGDVGYAFQRAEDQLFADTVLDDVAYGPRNLGMPKGLAREEAERALEAVGIDVGRLGGASPFALSGGQMRRVVLAGTIAMGTGFLVLDEPTVGLDAHGLAALAEMLENLRQRGKGVCIVSHDVDWSSRLADRVVEIEEGLVVWEGAPAAALTGCGGTGSGGGVVASGGVARFLRALEAPLAGDTTDCSDARAEGDR